MAIPLWLKEKLFQKKLILDSLNESVGKIKKDTKIYFSEHHLSHAAGAFYPSPFNEPIINSILYAYRSFMSTDLDMLVIENCVLYKKNK